MTTATAIKKKAKKKWEVPDEWERNLSPEEGGPTVKVKYGWTPIDAKLYYKVGGVRRLVRKKNGKPKTKRVKVKGTFVTVTIDRPVQKRAFRARSCCKPPDKFDAELGVLLALRRIFDEDDRNAVIALAHEMDPNAPNAETKDLWRKGQRLQEEAQKLRDLQKGEREAIIRICCPHYYHEKKKKEARDSGTD